MKWSRYNVLLPYRGQLFVYNTLYRTSILLEERTAAAWGLSGGVAQAPDSISPKAQEILKNKKSLADDTCDELALVAEQLELTNGREDKLELTILPTLGCNFKCWYCYEDHARRAEMSPEDVALVVDYLRHQLQHERLQQLTLSFFGGEPLLRYDQVVLPLLRQLWPLVSQKKDLLYRVAFTSNGYLLSTQRLVELRQLGLSSLQITLDGNRARHNAVRTAPKGQDSYATILQNVRSALALGVHVTLRLNVSEDTNLDVQVLSDDFQGLTSEQNDLLSFSVVRIWQADESLEPELQRIRGELTQRGFHCDEEVAQHTTIWNTCYADKRCNMVIGAKGCLYKCTARDFVVGNVEGQLLPDGQVEWNHHYLARIAATPLDFPECRRCNILPICGGGCSQKLMERKRAGTPCPMADNPEAKQQLAFERLASML